MILLYFLDTYVNLVKCLQIVLFDASFNWCYLDQDAAKTYSEVSNIKFQIWDHTSIQKQSSAVIWETILEA